MWDVFPFLRQWTGINLSYRECAWYLDLATLQDILWFWQQKKPTAAVESIIWEKMHGYLQQEMKHSGPQWQYSVIKSIFLHYLWLTVNCEMLNMTLPQYMNLDCWSEYIVPTSNPLHISFQWIPKTKTAIYQNHPNFPYLVSFFSILPWQSNLTWKTNISLCTQNTLL